MTLKDQILEALKEGPGLAAELAIEFGMDQRKMNANLVDLERRGFVQRTEFHQRGIARSVKWLYSLRDAA